ncbi:PepSY domain-containing protein [Marinobacter sp. ATCH36]|uniref:PepSY domain-containing protein n=1 Tax=Marinobacter sp. ATCH36 TaxID=2945106 RepID=UPI0020228229|nr:PepSY domain-containing protein [Marinobacter sp. ATCH36]MCL7944225.1 PepSY domain-containing protein [Marinobacter sp. ATCH36]
MKLILTTTLVTSLALAPTAHAADDGTGLSQVLDHGTNYGITHFVEIERDSDDNGRAEVEGWVDGDWLVELNIGQENAITKEERRRRIDGPWGMTADEVRQFMEASLSEGMTRVEEIKIDTSGYIEVEGYDKNGLELEVDFRRGNTQPVSVEQDS